MEILSKQFIAKRKSLTFIYPPVAIIMLTALFYMMGGGDGATAKAVADTNKKTGFDSSLPDASNTKVVSSKEQAYAEEEQKKSNVPSEFDFNNMDASRDDSKSPEAGTGAGRASSDVKDVYSKYENYYQAPAPTSYTPAPNPYRTANNRQQGYKKPTATEVQNVADGNPEPAKEQVQEPVKPKSIFFGSDRIEKEKVTASVLYAVVHGEQNVSNGAYVKMRVTQGGTYKGVNIPANTFVYGVAQISQTNRVTININSIKIPGNVISSTLKAYDGGDGQIGVFVTGGNVSGQVNSELDNIDVNTGNSTIGNVTQGVKDLLKKKAVSNQIVLTSNYKIILKDQ